MDPALLRDDFRRHFRGTLHTDAVRRDLYATDASLFRVEPLAVALPVDEEDLRFLVRYASDKGVPLFPRGAGTGLSGESLGHGIVVDLAARFRGILETGDDWVRVQPGVVLDALNAHLAPLGRRFAPDPASSATCTVGGMIATDASGSRAILHGRTSDHIRGLQVMWDDGSDASLPGSEPSTRTTQIADGLAEIASTYRAVLAEKRTAAFDRAGYRLRSLVGGIDLAKLLVGSEGTLAITLEATLRTIPLPVGRAAVVFGFPSFESALDAALAARLTEVSACEVLDRRFVVLARNHSPGAAAAVPPEIEAALLVEYERDSPAEAAEAVKKLTATLTRGHDGLIVIPASGENVDELWRTRAAALPSLYALGKGQRPLPFVEDVAVAPDDLPRYTAAAKGVLKRFDVRGSFVIHAATGHVHLRPFLDPDDPADTAKLWPMADEIHGIAMDLGGTISGQHGVGIARTPWMERQAGPLYPVHQEVKRLFDPRGILNPGKIVGPDPSRPAWPMRPTPTPRAVTPLLLWGADELQQAVAACNTCGSCRTQDTTLRMCPTFRATNDEAASPRSKANLMRRLLESDQPTDEDVRAVADLCVNCKMCATECPGKADIPKLMLEAKARHHAEHGLKRSTWFMARIDGLASLGSKVSLTSNFLLRRPLFRWAMEKAFGLARQRTLPAFAFRTFLGRARQRGLTRRPAGGPAVAFFVDTYANVFDPAVAEAALAVMRHNGVRVYVPSRQRGSGAAALSQGDADIARERLKANVRRLADGVRAGDTIVCTEPTAALFFRLDALGLSDDPDVRLVAEKTTELTAFLWNLHAEGKLKTDFQPLDYGVGHHVPCHIRALGLGIHGPKLLSLIPRMRVDTIDVGCSGMAGPYGLNVKNLPTSLAAGRPMLDRLADPANQYGSSECSSCRLQMQQGSGKRALHPVQYMALAYGLMPGVAARLDRPFRGRVSS